MPKKPNQLGLSGKALAGSLFKADPPEQTRALERAHAAANGAGTESDDRGEEE